MENEYFKPNPALRVASVEQDQVAGQQQAGLAMASMEARNEMARMNPVGVPSNFDQAGLGNALPVTQVPDQQIGLGTI